MFLKEDFLHYVTIQEAGTSTLTPGSFLNIAQILNLELLMGLISK